MVYTTYVKEMSYLHTHNIHTWFFWVIKSCGLQEEGRRDYKEGLRYGASKDKSYDYIGVAWVFSLVINKKFYCETENFT